MHELENHKVLPSGVYIYLYNNIYSFGSFYQKWLTSLKGFKQCM